MVVRPVRPVRALVWAPAVAGLACAVLAGCGQAAARNTAAAGGAVVCADPTHVDRLTLSRTNTNPERFTFPAEIAITGPQQARSVARALCQLPVMPPGVFHCPDDFGISYRLDLVTSGHTLIPVHVQASGCQNVYGLGPVRWIARTPAFWRVLGKAAGLSHASHSTFSGTLAS